MNSRRWHNIQVSGIVEIDLAIADLQAICNSTDDQTITEIANHAADILGALQRELPKIQDPIAARVQWDGYRGMDKPNVSAFESSIVYRLAVELARTWVVAHWTTRQELPAAGVLFAYPRGPEAAIDWGDDPGEPDAWRPLKGLRVRVELSIEPWNAPVLRESR
jgi:hypothetical protein